LAVDKAELKLTNLNKNPVAHLHACIADHSITADYIICCGDLGHRADQQGIRFSWNFLNDLQLRIGAKATFATVGNHDVDSRFKDEEPNPFEFLKGLNPAFPFSAAADFDKYWSRNFTVTVDPPYRYLVLNTCSSHGYEKEYERGLVSPWTLGEIRKVLSAQDSFLVNILVAHHHPHRHTELGLGDQDDIKGGDALMQLLSEPQFGKWLVIHGHKHHAKICQGDLSALFGIMLKTFHLIVRSSWINAQHSWHIWPRILRFPSNLHPRTFRRFTLGFD